MEYNEENYRKEIKQIESEFLLKKSELAKMYAFENNPYKIGDIVTDHIGSIIIEKIQFTRPYGDKLPYCVYYGFELKKDGNIRKDKSKRSVRLVDIENK